VHLEASLSANSYHREANGSNYNGQLSCNNGFDHFAAQNISFFIATHLKQSVTPCPMSLVDLLKLLFTPVSYHTEIDDTWHADNHDIVSHRQHNHDVFVQL
jgi:hypothetical protein